MPEDMNPIIISQPVAREAASSLIRGVLPMRSMTDIRSVLPRVEKRGSIA